MDIIIPKPVNEVLNTLYENNYEAYVIGGAVRNLVMGEKPKNYNISTNINVKKVKDVLNIYNTYYKGENNSSLGIVNAKYPMEIAQYRTKENTLEADLATRDFTMNALAYNDEDGLIDYNTGLIDIRNKIIKLNGEDDTLIKVDPLRILRAIRLSAEYGMRIDQKTQEYMLDNKDLLSDVAPERIRDELSKILVTRRADFYIKKYFDIFLVIIPELALMERFEQNNPHHIYDVLEHTLVTMKCIEPNLELRLTMLFHDIGKPFTAEKDENGICRFKNHHLKSAEIARDVLNRLKFNKNTIKKVIKLIENHDYVVPKEKEQIVNFLSTFGTENIDDFYKIQKANFYGKNPAYAAEISEIEESYARLKACSRKTSFVKKSDMKVNGKDLYAMGIKDEEIGSILNRVYEKMLEGKLKNNREKLISYVVETEGLTVPNLEKIINN